MLRVSTGVLSKLFAALKHGPDIIILGSKSIFIRIVSKRRLHVQFLNFSEDFQHTVIFTDCSAFLLT